MYTNHYIFLKNKFFNISMFIFVGCCITVLIVKLTNKKMSTNNSLNTGGLEEAKEYMMEKEIPQLFEVEMHFANKISSAFEENSTLLIFVFLIQLQSQQKELLNFYVINISYLLRVSLLNCDSIVCHNYSVVIPPQIRRISIFFKF